MDGIGIPILGFLLGLLTTVLCLTRPRLRRFALAAFISPFAASIVFLVGLFIIADMDPNVEYGAEYIRAGQEHTPTAFDIGIRLGSAAATFILSAFLCVKAQRIAERLVRCLSPWNAR